MIGEGGFEFQSPSLRGSGRFQLRPQRGPHRRREVSIPFIAGQWSLHISHPYLLDVECTFQSPSLRGSGRFVETHRETLADLVMFQSPSLRGSGRFHTGIPSGSRFTAMFQSPSLRGSGRFTLELLYESLRKYEFQSPSLRGSGRFPWPATGPCPSSSGFNPLHCGAVVASTTSSPASRPCWRFQSPSLRGSGRFFTFRGKTNMSELGFQSPSLRGSGRFLRMTRWNRIIYGLGFNPLHCGAVVASRSGSVTRRTASSFNPLHCGAVVASS